METNWKKQAHYVKLLNQEKTMKLIQRLYIGDSLKRNQLDKIVELVETKGVKREKVVDYQRIFQPDISVKYDGMEYAGIIVYSDGYTKCIDYYDHREERLKSVRLYDDGTQVFC